MCSVIPDCSMKKDIQKRRANAVRGVLKAKGLDALYVRNTANIEWMSAFNGVFDDEQAHALFLGATTEPFFIHTDSRYSAAMEREAEDTLAVIDAERIAFSKWAASKWYDYISGSDMGAKSTKADGSAAGVGNDDTAVAKGTANTAKLAIENTLELGEFRRLEKAFVCAGECSAINNDASSKGIFAETDGLLLRVRSVKDEFEIGRLREAQSVTDAAFTYITEVIKPGMTEREVQLALNNFMLSHGADSLAFASIIASGANGASPHAIVSDKKLEAGECIVMDFGARKNGYCSDMTRTVFLGEPEGEMLCAWEALRCANESVQEMLSPGVTGKAAHELAISILDDAGFAGRMGHGLGHGVGVEIHELPVLSPSNEDPLEMGNVVTVEPGIYIPDKFGMRLEDFGVIRDTGFERFTTSTHEMVVL